MAETGSASAAAHTHLQPGPHLDPPGQEVAGSTWSSSALPAGPAQVLRLRGEGRRGGWGARGQRAGARNSGEWFQGYQPRLSASKSNDPQIPAAPCRFHTQEPGCTIRGSPGIFWWAWRTHPDPGQRFKSQDPGPRARHLDSAPSTGWTSVAFCGLRTLVCGPLLWWPQDAGGHTAPPPWEYTASW